jgi:hypothetical protein
MAQPVSAEEFLQLGDEMSGQQRRPANKTELGICSIVWGMIISDTVLVNSAKPVQMLWAFMFMKLYCSKSVLAVLAGGVHEQTFRKWAWYFVELIADLQYRVIKWENWFEGDIGNACLVSVDGTDFWIYQWAPFWTGWYCHKFKGLGVQYEVALNIITGRIVWIHGPFPCGKWPDLKIFWTALKHILGPGGKVIANKGYQGEPNHVVLPTGDISLLANLVHGRQEHVNKRFKQWQILHRVFRHDVQKHQPIFCAVATITEVCLENGEPLFVIEYIDDF